jgi:ribonuclease J
MVEIGKRGIDVLLCESTNALSPGFSNSEKYVVDELKREIKIAKGRIFMSIFASNMSRIDEIIRTAIANKRKVVLLGRAMINNVQSSISAGILKVPKSEIISVQDYNDAQYPENQLFFLMTGSQGEEMAALNLIASGKHSSIQFNDRDLVILSSNPIPGNYEQVESLINKLYKTGVNVNINSSEKNLHSTGHATQTESQLLIKLICPKYIVPVHGSFDQMTALRKNGEFSGVPHDNLLVVVNGQKIKLFNNHTAVITDEFVDIYPNFVDSNNKLNKDSVELFNNRLKLSENGIVAVTVKVDKKAKKVLETPLISTKGCFSVTNSKNLIDTIISAIKKNIESAMAAKENNIGDGEIKKIVESTTEYYSWKYKNKKPLVKTIIFTAENPVHL